MAPTEEALIQEVVVVVQEATETEDLRQEELLVQGQQSMEEMEEQVLAEVVMDCLEITLEEEEVEHAQTAILTEPVDPGQTAWW